MKRFFVIRQRVTEGNVFILGKIWSSGYLVDAADNIVDGFWCLMTPCSRWAYQCNRDMYGWCRVVLSWRRSRGLFLIEIPEELLSA